MFDLLKKTIPKKLKNYLKEVRYKYIYSKFISSMEKKHNLIWLAQYQAEEKFFCANPDEIKNILNGQKICFFDIGARGGIEDKVEKYKSLLNITLVEPDPEEARVLENNGYTVIKELLGSEKGNKNFNIGHHGGTSSFLEPTGTFLEFYTSGNTKRFDVIDKIELPVTTLEEVLNKTGQRIDYIKLDTQGSELQILEGMGVHRPIIIKTEISFVPLYQDSAIFFHLGKLLYDMGYILFHTTHYARSSPEKYRSPQKYNETNIPTHGDAWFCPDWTRKEGISIIKGREDIYKALMLMFGMRSIFDYAMSSINSEKNVKSQ